MAGAVFSLFMALLIFIVLTESLTINLKVGENYTVTFNFIVFAITLKSGCDTKRESKQKSDAKKRKRKFWYSQLILILSGASVRIDSLFITLPDGKPSLNSISYGISATVVSSFLAFLEYNSKFFEARNIRISHSEHNTLKKELEAELKIYLLDLIAIEIGFLISLLRSRYSNVRMRKSNE